MKKTIIALLGLCVVCFGSAPFVRGCLSQPETTETWFRYVTYPASKVTVWAPSVKDTDQKLTCRVTAANTIYYIVGSTLRIVKPDNNTILVPNINLADNPEQGGWGKAGDSVRIGVAVDRSVVVVGQPLYAQVTIENSGNKPFEMRYGCGPNMDLALPEITNSQGTVVGEKFVIGQVMCWGTFPYDIPARTTAKFVFNVLDLYNAEKPGKYSMAIRFPRDHDQVMSQARDVSSKTVHFVVR